MAYIVIPIPVGDISKFMPCIEKMEHYEAQIKTITEDFQLEREARAKAHQRAEDLEREVNQLKLQLKKQRQAIKDAANNRYALPRYECDSDSGNDDL